MSGNEIQGWDVAIELDETSLTEQVSSFLRIVFSGEIIPLSLQGSFSSIRAAIHLPELKFIVGEADQLRINLIVDLNDVPMHYTVIGQIKSQLTMRGELVLLDLENANLEVDTMRFTQEVRNRLADVGVTVADSNEFRTALITLIRDSLRFLTGNAHRDNRLDPGIRSLLEGLPPVPAFPLSAPVPRIPIPQFPPAPLQMVGRVVTDRSSPMQRAFVLFTRSLSSTPDPGLPTGNGEVHFSGQRLSAVVIRNQFLTSQILCPALNTVPPAPFVDPVTRRSRSPNFNDSGNAVCTSRTRVGIVGAPRELVITSMTLSIDGGQNQFVLTGSFEIVEPVKWASGTFSMRFGLRWNQDTSRVEIADGPPPAVSVNIEAWVWIVLALGGGTIGGFLGVLAGGPIGAAIGGIVGAAVGVIAVGILQEIIRTIATMSITRTAQGFVGTPIIPFLPLLAPTRLITQNVRLDDLVIVSRLEVANVEIRGELQIIDRQYLSTSAPPFNRVRLTWQGTFEAVPVHLTAPFRFLWTVNGMRLYDEGEISVNQGTLRYQINGGRCTLTTTHGTSLNELLCVEVQDANGIWMLSCKSLQALGERTELKEINPPDPWINPKFRIPPYLIPDPAPDLTFNPEAVARIQSAYISAVARGMGVKLGSL